VGLEKSNSQALRWTIPFCFGVATSLDQRCKLGVRLLTKGFEHELLRLQLFQVFRLIFVGLLQFGEQVLRVIVVQGGTIQLITKTGVLHRQIATLRHASGELRIHFAVFLVHVSKFELDGLKLLDEAVDLAFDLATQLVLFADQQIVAVLVGIAVLVLLAVLVLAVLVGIAELVGSAGLFVLLAVLVGIAVLVPLAVLVGSVVLLAELVGSVVPLAELVGSAGLFVPLAELVGSAGLFVLLAELVGSAGRLLDNGGVAGDREDDVLRDAE